MKKGDVVTCTKPKVDYLTEGFKYTVVAGIGDVVFTVGCETGYQIKGESGFSIFDDAGDCIFQSSLDGCHGEFVVIK